MNILVTGGAGFIGSHTVDALLAAGHRVRVLDNLQKPVHLKGRPTYLPASIDFIEGDVRHRATLRRALDGMDAVFHFAAYQDYLPDFSTFFDVNATSTALLYELIVEHRLPIRKVVVAASQAVAGEGLYVDDAGCTFTPEMRPEDQLRRGQWEILDARGRPARWQPTPETVANPRNAYGMSKLAEEMIAIHLGKRYGIPSVAMRYSIVQGPRQSFYNAYSGACRIFSLSYFLNRPPVIYEDGLQVRDYVNIHDVVDANLLVLTHAGADYRVFNVGGGKAWTVTEFCDVVASVYGSTIGHVLPGQYRYGDTRHILSDTAALQALGWAPRRGPRESVEAYVAYLREQTDIEDILDFARKKMSDLNVIRTVQSS